MCLTTNKIFDIFSFSYAIAFREREKIFARKRTNRNATILSTSS